MKKTEMIKKLDEDDILRILVTHFQVDDFGESWGHGEFLGTPGKDLRFIGIFRNDLKNLPFHYDVKEVDRSIDFTGE